MGACRSTLRAIEFLLHLTTLRPTNGTWFGRAHGTKLLCTWDLASGEALSMTYREVPEPVGLLVPGLQGMHQLAHQRPEVRERKRALFAGAPDDGSFAIVEAALWK